MERLTPRRVLLVPRAADAPASAPGTLVAVLDTAWIPTPGGRADLVSLLPAIGRVLDADDPFTRGRELLDDWAARAGVAAATTVDGVSWWYRYRFGLWLRLVEQLHWRATLDELIAEHGPFAAIEVPQGEPGLAAAAELVGARDGIAFGVTPPPPPARPSLVDRILWRLGRGERKRRLQEVERRAALLAERREWLRPRTDALLAEAAAARAADGPGRLLALTVPSVHQRAQVGGVSRAIDPFLDPVLARLEGTPLEPIRLALNVELREDAAWARVEPDERLIPEPVVEARWADPADEPEAKAAAAGVVAALEALPTVPLSDGGVDFGPGVHGELVHRSRTFLPGRLVEIRRATRFLGELRPAGLLCYNEYGRIEWLIAARAHGIPTFAVQHGIIYPGHLGYRHERAAGLVLPDRTFLFGAYEERVLREFGGYRPDEVATTGSPRLSLVPGEPASAEERAAVRRELGVADDRRLVVLSTTHEPVHRRFYWMHALARLLAEPLGDAHLVFKQHPSEKDEGDYRSLVEGLARVGGFAPPPVTVVREIDLYRLLRAADAHVGLYSTVITDAVAAGTPNLVALTQLRRDLLGYVPAGVAVGVATPAELRAALVDPRPPTTEARAAFLEEHFRPGDGAGRIADEIVSATLRVPTVTAW